MKSNFFNLCYDVARKIPFGRVTTYGAIAKYLGLVKSARIVGYAMTSSHGKDVPAQESSTGMVYSLANITLKVLI